MNVHLRPICLGDVDHIMSWINRPDVTRNFAEMSREITREQELAFLAKMIASETDKLYAICANDGTYLGNAGIHKIYWPAKNGRLGIVVGNAEAQGKGVGSAALRALCKLGFNDLGLHKLWIIHFRDNQRMNHMATQLGFQQEGILRDEYFHNDRYHDMVRLSLLSTDPLTD